MQTAIHILTPMVVVAGGAAVVAVTGTTGTAVVAVAVTGTQGMVVVAGAPVVQTPDGGGTGVGGLASL